MVVVAVVVDASGLLFIVVAVVVSGTLVVVDCCAGGTTLLSATAGAIELITPAAETTLATDLSSITMPTVAIATGMEMDDGTYEASPFVS